MDFTSRNILATLGALAGVGGLVIACGSSNGSEFNDPNVNNGSFFNDGGGFNDAGGSQEDLYKNDPPPPWCGPDGGPAAPPAPSGTAECPDDKNKPGCGCTTPGETAACWTGLRKHRHLGQCKDGTTKCIQKSENTFVWGSCDGEVLPDPNATKGEAACGCFSAGQWKIANLIPCIATWDPDGAGPQPVQYTAVSTILDGNGVAQCPTYSGPATKPGPDWSTDTLKGDCAGTFKLCYRIKAGSFENPQATDCTVGEICADEAFYEQPGTEQTWPVLHSWIGGDAACAQKWHDTPAGVSPGYGEMIVKGKSVQCEAVDDGAGNDYMFNRIKYCPTSCKTDPSTPECQACQQSGQGSF